MQTYRIRISGTVQGVGFRPFIYNLARRFSLRGEVGNDSLGVVITCNTSKEILSQFISRIENEAPPLSRIDRIMVTEILPCSFEDFRIVQSRSQNVATTLIPPE
jgi:hydrogenase maturation protein HypF